MGTVAMGEGANQLLQGSWGIMAKGQEKGVRVGNCLEVLGQVSARGC